MMVDDAAKNAARARVGDLVRSFKRNEGDYLRANYNETQARTDFITPLLTAFGWDVHNIARHPTGLREVIEEATVEVGETGLSKKPDYELRLVRQRKMFVEAKKPNIRIDRSRDAAFQTRRYGYSANLPISVLTNFHQIAIYDCVPAPLVTDDANVARLLIVRYDEIDAHFDDLWALISRDSIYSGEFDRKFDVGTARHVEQFDDFFLRQIHSWRERLAVDMHANTPGLSPAELTYAVQLFLSRIVFLRICEDREIERYETLRNLPLESTFDALMGELRRADAFYDSGLFRLLDDARLGIRLSNDVLHSVISELYYPQSPYTFAVVETEVLGEIYEQFLGEEIVMDGGVVSVVRKPEVRESGGVVPTPRYIVDAIVARTLMPALANRGPLDLSDFTVADICCGSGIFLLSVYEFIMNHCLDWYMANHSEEYAGRTIYLAEGGEWRLTFEEKRRILITHVRGVDIDASAVEVAQFSLLLKLIENETQAGLSDFVARKHERVLPDLGEILRAGNSLVSQAEWAAAMNGPIPAELIAQVNPFDWGAEFLREMSRGGFDVIVGNPPYIRIQKMTSYSPEEAAFYQSSDSPYTTAYQDNFDKYALFFERGLSLLPPHGRLGFITPHKFMTIQAGRALRRLLTLENSVEQIVHFGVEQVFGRAARNYTCIMVLDRRRSDTVRVEKVNDLVAWRYGKSSHVMELPSVTLSEEPWQFAATDTRNLFQRVRLACLKRLGALAEIFVGVQTSADDVYIFPSVAENEEFVSLRWNGRDWPIERGILRPCLHDVQLFAYARPQPNAWMIFPYNIVTGRARPEATLIQLDDMVRRFPKGLTYLEARRGELESRHVSGGRVAERQFYQFGRSQSLVKFNSSKIILPALSLEPRYAYDDSNIVVTGGGNGPYYLLRTRDSTIVSDKYLLAVLNHPLSEAFIRTNTSSFRGGYYAHGKQFIEDLPVPTADQEQRSEIDHLVTQITAALTVAAASRTPREKTVAERSVTTIRNRIETSVSELFTLSAADLALVHGVEVPG